MGHTTNEHLDRLGNPCNLCGSRTSNVRLGEAMILRPGHTQEKLFAQQTE
jgi:hypothetical protein